MNRKKTIAIIGAGIAGLTTGIYALENGYDVTIYEKHSIVGGQCTGWYREKTFIDGCAHWIVGTNPKSDLYPLWEHVGAFNEKSKMFPTEYFCKYDIDGEIITIYADLEKLKNELLRVAPTDKKQINRFINGIKAYQNVKIPVNKPLDCLNLFELMLYGIHMLPMLFHFMYYKKTSVKQYAKKFKTDILRKLFGRLMDEKYNIHSFIYIMQALSKNDAAMVEGGSLKLAYRIKDRFIKLGGKLLTNCEVKNIIIEKDVAKGICINDNQLIYSDYVISTTDAYHTMKKLLNNQYDDYYYQYRFDNINDYPIQTSMLFTYKVNKNVDNIAKMTQFEIDPIKIANNVIKEISVRNYSFDKTLNNGCTTFGVLMGVDDAVYDYLASLPHEKYIKEKNRVANEVLDSIKKYFNFKDDDITLIDVATPLTYNRYANAYKGSYMSFITTKKSKGLMRKGLISGLKNFVMAGQWLMPPGGLPIALFTGKHAIYRICKMDKKEFINLENKLIIKRNKKAQI